MKNNGFTLIEMMIVVVIIGILSAIAYPSYQRYVLRSGCVAATAAMLSAASDLERYRARTSAYTDSRADTDFRAQSPESGAVQFNIRFSTLSGDPAPPNPAPRIYTLEAVPVVNFQPVGTLTLNNLGQRSDNWDCDF